MVCEYSGKSDGPANFHYESDKYSGTPETSGIISDQGWWTQHSAKWTLVVPKWTLKAPKRTQLDLKSNQMGPESIHVDTNNEASES